MTQPHNTSTFAWIGRQKWILVVAAIIAAVVTAYWYFSSYRPKSVATEYIAKLLLDPESAKFQNVRFVDGGTVCGEVNGKNLLGAYTGFTPFVYAPYINNGFIGNAPNPPTVTGDAALDAFSRVLTRLLAEKSEKCNSKI